MSRFVCSRSRCVASMLALFSASAVAIAAQPPDAPPERQAPTTDADALSRARAVGTQTRAARRFYTREFDLSGLPESIRNGHDFFLKALEHKVIVVPGEVFDVDPGGRRTTRPSRFRHHVRFSFGPSLATMERAIERLAAMVRAA